MGVKRGFRVGQAMSSRSTVEVSWWLWGWKRLEKEQRRRSDWIGIEVVMFWWWQSHGDLYHLTTPPDDWPSVENCGGARQLSSAPWLISTGKWFPQTPSTFLGGEWVLERYQPRHSGAIAVLTLRQRNSLTVYDLPHKAVSSPRPSPFASTVKTRSRHTLTGLMTTGRHRSSESERTWPGSDG